MFSKSAAFTGAAENKLLLLPLSFLRHPVKPVTEISYKKYYESNYM